MTTPYRFEPVHVQNLEREFRQLGLWDVLHDETLTDVMVNEDGAVFVCDGDGTRVLDRRLEAGALESCLATVAGLHGQVLRADSPILEAVLPFGRLRLEAIVPPVVAAPVLCLRRPATRLLTLDELETRGSLPAPARAILEAAVATRKTMLIAGAVGTGKTALASALLGYLLETEPDTRLVVVEEGARELAVPPGANVTRLLAAEGSGVTLTQLVRAALRLNPDRLLVGEVRGAEALDFVRAANTGHPGGISTLHANSALDALARLQDLVAEVGVTLSPARVVSAIDLVVYLVRRGPRRQVATILTPTLDSGTGELSGRVLWSRELSFTTSPSSPSPQGAEP